MDEIEKIRLKFDIDKKIDLNFDNKNKLKVLMLKGDDGFDPYIISARSGKTTTVTVTDYYGTQSFDIYDGVDPTVTAVRDGNKTTLTITDVNGTRTADIYDGIDLTGGVPTDGVIGWTGADEDIPNGYEATTELQEKLVSGTNIKTINNTSILGSGDVSISGSAPTGTITMFAGSTAPSGYLICDGSAISRDDYADLFTVIGTTYGTGDGSTTFNIPDFKGRVPVGFNTSDTAFDTLGETGGEKTHTLTVQEMPSHRHATRFGGTAPGDGSGYQYSNTDGTSTQIVQAEGGGQAHNNLQPYIVVNYIIKY